MPKPVQEKHRPGKESYVKPATPKLLAIEAALAMDLEPAQQTQQEEEKRDYVEEVDLARNSA